LFQIKIADSRRSGSVEVAGGRPQGRHNSRCPIRRRSVKASNTGDYAIRLPRGSTGTARHSSRVQEIL